MNILELKHIAPYLPYNVKCLNQHLPDKQFVVEELVGISNHITWSGVFNAKHGSNHTPICAIKPILRPLSDLKNTELTDLYIDLIGAYNGVVINDIIDNKRDTSFISYYYTERLLQNHFDVFGLIEKGLAIDINKL